MNRSSFGRAVAITISVIGLAASMGLFVTLWLSPEAGRLRQLRELVDITHLFVQFAIALIIAWRGGGRAPNVALALALVFAFGADTWELWQLHVWPDSWLLHLGSIVLFFLGASLYIRATQRFPRAIGPADVMASPTIWGRVRVLRVASTFLLRPCAVWVVVACLTSLLILSSNVYIAGAVRIVIVLLGMLYFYITFRSGDTQARAKVLWFLEAVVAFVMVAVIVLGVRAVLGDTPAPTLRASLSLVLTVVNDLALTTCFVVAVFYAGAIDPALVVRKTLVVGATASLLLFVFAAFEHYLVHLLVHGIGVTNSIATAVLGALCGYAFHPVKHRLEHLLKRLLPSGGAIAHESQTSSSEAVP
jgi:hypothetical protein